MSEEERKPPQRSDTAAAHGNLAVTKNCQKEGVTIGLGKPPGSQNQCFSTYFNQEKSSNGVKYNCTPPQIVFGPIPDKDHGRNQHFLIC